MGQSTTEELLLIGSICFMLYTSDVSGTLWHVGTFPYHSLRFLFMGELAKGK